MKEIHVSRSILAVTSRYPREAEDRVDRDYTARRSPNQFSFSQEDLLSAAEGADAPSLRGCHDHYESY
jgi:hypothetical protein